MRYLSYPKKYSTNEALESKDFYFLWCICVRIRKQVMGKPALTDKKKQVYVKCVINIHHHNHGNNYFKIVQNPEKKYILYNYVRIPFQTY